MENSFHNPRFGGGGTSVREAIGVAKAAIQLSHKDIPIHIYPPHVIKKAATNNTKADKLEVATEICNTLGIKKFILERTVRNKVVVEEFTVKELIKSDKDHVTDALSAAYTPLSNARRRWHEMALFKKKKKEEEFVWVDLDDDYEWTELKRKSWGLRLTDQDFIYPPQRQPQDIPRTKNKRKTNKRQRQRQIPSMEQMPSDNRTTYDTYNSHYGEPYDSGFGADDLPMDYEYDEDIIAQIQKKKNKKLKIILVTLGYLLFIVIGIFLPPM